MADDVTFEIRRSIMIHCSHQALAGSSGCTRLHGHTFQVTLVCESYHLDTSGFSVDFFDFDSAFDVIKERFDHRHLNDIIDTPSCEGLAMAIGKMLRPMLPHLTAVVIDEVGIGTVTYRFNRRTDAS